MKIKTKKGYIFDPKFGYIKLDDPNAFKKIKTKTTKNGKKQK